MIQGAFFLFDVTDSELVFIMVPNEFNRLSKITGMTLLMIIHTEVMIVIDDNDAVISAFAV